MNGEKVEYSIVGASESDPVSGKISSESPLAHSLIGKAKGEKVEIILPSGNTQCEIIDIK